LLEFGLVTGFFVPPGLLRAFLFDVSVRNFQ
jgi:hypothetical protein